MERGTVSHRYVGHSKKVNVQVRREHYYSTDYDTKQRFCSYWHQIHEILVLKQNKVLEIGVGNGFVCKYLRERGADLVSLDIDKELQPDVVGSVLNIPFRDRSFGTVACYELLEHLPYDHVAEALSEISRVCGQYVILSLPDVERVYRIHVQIPGIGYTKRLLPLPRIRKPVHSFDGEHYWEIGKAGYPLNRIISEIQKQGLRLQKTYRVHEMPYHRFFVLGRKA